MSQSIANMHLHHANFFEGVEKLLEVWFTRKDGMTANCDLRKIPRERLEEIMDLVKCEIISVSSSEDLDAYVLSESSMFISNRRFILKTCGSTTTLCCLPQLMALVQEYTGYDTVQDLYYSRKCFKRPELQPAPHQSFDEEAKILDRYFPGQGGRAYCMGSLNGEDCWYLYVISPGHTRKELFSKQIRPECRIGKLRHEPDQTLEILMTDVDPKKMTYFYKTHCLSAKEATKHSGIDNLIPGMVIDDFLFDPCGYSMNGLSRTVPGGYMTIHITPEPAFSYVSFETNIPHKNYKDLIYRVVHNFNPKQFVVTFFSTQASASQIGIGEEDGEEPEYGDYFSEDIQICRLPGYDLTYALYNRFPS